MIKQNIRIDSVKRPRNQPFHRQLGASLAEFIIVFHVFCLLGLGTYQWIVLAEVKATLNHATFMGARKGALNNADAGMIEGAIAEYMAPLYSPDSGNTANIVQRTGHNPVTGRCLQTPHLPGSEEVIKLTCHDLTAHSRIRILNPTREAFADFATDVNGDGEANEIQATDLNMKSSEPGAESGVNIQDANLLKVEVVYGYRLGVPLVGWIIPKVMQKYAAVGSLESTLLSQQRIPLRASSIVRMQTPAILNDAMLTRAEAEGIVEELETPSIVRDLPDRPWCAGPVGQSCSTEPVVPPCGG